MESINLSTLYQNDLSELILPDSNYKTLQRGTLTSSSKITQFKCEYKLYTFWFRFKNCFYLWNIKLGKAHSVTISCHRNLNPLHLKEVSNILFPKFKLERVAQQIKTLHRKLVVSHFKPHYVLDKALGSNLPTRLPIVLVRLPPRQ